MKTVDIGPEDNRHCFSRLLSKNHLYFSLSYYLGGHIFDCIATFDIYKGDYLGLRLGKSP